MGRPTDDGLISTQQAQQAMVELQLLTDMVDALVNTVDEIKVMQTDTLGQTTVTWARLGAMEESDQG